MKPLPSAGRQLLRRISGVLRGFRFQRVAAPRIHATATFVAGPGVRRSGGRIVVAAGASLVLERDVELDADILVGEGCRATIGTGSRLRNTLLDLRNGAVVEIGPGALFDSPLPEPNRIAVNNGTFRTGENVRIQAEVLVRFGGLLTIGRYTGIGYGSEIRCEERVEIGEYGLFSYEVCIYDTNTHATDWQERRQMIKRQYATGAGEQRRPDTQPVRIGSDVWIGRGATVLKGSDIGDRCIVGIRAVVASGAIPPDSVVVAPAPRVITR